VELDCRHCAAVPPLLLPLDPPLLLAVVPLLLPVVPRLLPVQVPPEPLPETVSHSLAHDAVPHCCRARSSPWQAPLVVICVLHEATLHASYVPPGQTQLM
jgi:hypothetical protein